MSEFDLDAGITRLPRILTLDRRGGPGACLLESVGIASTSRGVRWPDPIALLRSSLLSVSIRLADVTIGAIRLLGRGVW